MFGWLLQGLIVLLLRIVIAAVLLFVVFVAFFTVPAPPAATPCGASWTKAFERNYVGGGDRHGPDGGGGEWFHGIESVLQMQPLDSSDPDANCKAVVQEISNHRYVRDRLLGILIRVY